MKLRKEHIAYILWNHENNLDSAMHALGDDFTLAEVLKVAKEKKIVIH